MAVFGVGTVARAGTWRDEKTFWEQAVADSPRSHRAHVNLGLLYAGEGRAELAEKEYRRALELAPDDPGALNDLATLYLDRGRHDEALPLLTRAAAKDPRNCAVEVNLGVFYQKKGDLAAALDHLERAVRANPNYTLAHFQTGVTHYLRKDYAAAEQAFRRCLELSPAYADAYTNLGAAVFAQGRKDEGVAAWRRALELNPGAADAGKNLERWGGSRPCTRSAAAANVGLIPRVLRRRRSGSANPNGLGRPPPGPEDAVWVKVEWDERDLAERVKAAGGSGIGSESFGSWLGLKGRVIGRFVSTLEITVESYGFQL